MWWAFVTVTTVGYGDFYPVTTWGRIKGARREVTLAELDERLARIERLLTAMHPGSPSGAIDSG